MRPLRAATTHSAGSPLRYQFRVRGSVSETAMAAFPELSQVSGATGGTVLFGPVRDHSDVLSILARFFDLGLWVVEMRQLPD